MRLQKAHPNIFIFIVVSMTLILGFGIDLYSPSFPAIAQAFNVSSQAVQLTIATYFFGYTIGLLFFGPLSDTFGRRYPLLAGLVIYIVMSLLCASSTSFTWLLFWRFLQGGAVSAVGVMSRSILGDAFTGKRLVTSMTYYSMSYRIGPIVAPLIGGYLEAYLGWASNFYFLAAYGAVVILLVFFLLPETHFDFASIHPKNIFAKYVSFLKLPPFVGGALCMGMIYSIMIIFNVIAPFFIQDVLGYGPIDYGHIAFIMGIFAFLGIVTNRLLIQKFSYETMINIGISSMLLTSIVQVGLAIVFPTNLYSFLAPVMVILFCSGLVTANISAMLLHLVPKGLGTASSIVSIFIITCTGILSGFSSFLKSSTAIPFSLAFCVILFACFLSYTLLFKRAVKDQK